MVFVLNHRDIYDFKYHFIKKQLGALLLAVNVTTKGENEMALINGKDCNSEVSDSAEACPKCGAPVPKTIGEDEKQCPHCMTVVHRAANKCPGCRTVKGYLYDSRYGVAGKISAIGWGIIVPVILALVFLSPSGGLSLLLLSFAAYAAFRVFVIAPPPDGLPPRMVIKLCAQPPASSHVYFLAGLIAL